MALSAGVDWDCRSGGSNNNGGGFNRSASGTDRSQSTAGWIEIEQSAVVGSIQATTTNFKFTLGYTVTSADVGNIVNFTGSGAGGLGTVGHYEIMSISGSDTWVLDRSAGTSGGVPTGIMGGAKAKPADIYTTTTPMVAGNNLYVKGAYNIGSGDVLTSPAIANVGVFGYSTTHGDGVKQTWTINASSVTIIAVSSTSAVGHLFQDIIFDGNSQTNSRGYNGSNGQVAFVNCEFKNFLLNACTTTIQNRFTNCYFTGCATSTVFNGSTGGTVLEGCQFSGNSTVNFALGTGGRAQLIHCVFYDGSGSTSDYVQISNAAAYCDCFNCTFVGSGRHGINYQGNASASIVQNCIFSNNASYGISTTATNPPMVIINNAFYVGSGTGATTGLATFRTIGSITLSGDPFVNSGSDNYQIDNTSGEGAACRNTGYPSTLGGQAPYRNVGAFDLQNGGGSSGYTYAWVGG